MINYESKHVTISKDLAKDLLPSIGKKYIDVIDNLLDRKTHLYDVSIFSYGDNKPSITIFDKSMFLDESSKLRHENLISIKLQEKNCIAYHSFYDSTLSVTCNTSDNKTVYFKDFELPTPKKLGQIIQRMFW